MFKCVLLFILFTASVHCVELRGGLQPLTAESTEKEKRALKVAAGWIDCKRIAVYAQSPRMFFFIPSSNRDLNITVTIEKDKTTYVTDNYLLTMGSGSVTYIYDKDFEACNAYKVKWISKEAATSKNSRMRNGKPISDYVDQGEQIVKMPCKCKQSVVQLYDFQLQTLNGAKYTYPEQKTGPCTYTLLRSCRTDTKMQINATIVSNRNGPALISMLISFPKLFAHEVILSPSEPAKLNDAVLSMTHDNHHLGAEIFGHGPYAMLLFTDVDIRLLWDSDKKRATITVGDEKLSMCGMLAYEGGKPSDKVEKMPQSTINEWMVPESCTEGKL